MLMLTFRKIHWFCSPSFTAGRAWCARTPWNARSSWKSCVWTKGNIHTASILHLLVLIKTG